MRPPTLLAMRLRQLLTTHWLVPVVRPSCRGPFPTYVEMVRSRPKTSDGIFCRRMRDCDEPHDLVAILDRLEREPYASNGRVVKVVMCGKETWLPPRCTLWCDVSQHLVGAAPVHETRAFSIPSRPSPQIVRDSTGIRRFWIEAYVARRVAHAAVLPTHRPTKLRPSNAHRKASEFQRIEEKKLFAHHGR